MIEIFKDKTVAFVGLAPVIEGKGLGEQIDSYDVVYRTNFLPKNTTDYGSKCDVISVLKDCFNLLDTHQVTNIVLFDDIEIDRNKYLVTHEERAFIREKYIDQYGLDIIDATAGLIAYYLADKYEAKSFKFFGITGYQNLQGKVVNHSVVNHYSEEAYNMFGRSRVNMAKYDCHNFANHNKILKSLLKSKKIEMDQYSLEYFK